LVRQPDRHPSLVVALAVSAIVSVAPRGATAQTLTFSHLAGSLGGPGSADGVGSAARFVNPRGVAADASGTVYVADPGNHTIRRISSGGTVTTLAGLAGIPGSADGTGSAARFNTPLGVAVDPLGNVYVSDRNNHAIRKVTAAGVVTTLAGLPQVGGTADGTGSAARFSFPESVAVEANGTLYVADTVNNTIRRVTAGGTVTTLAGLAQAAGSADGTGSTARFNSPSGVAVDATGTVYVTDRSNYTIRRITAGGAVTTLAGLAGAFGYDDGTGSGARFNSPRGVAVDASGILYVTDTNDTNNHRIRTVTASGTVTTLAGGQAGLIFGSTDGTGSAARFYGPTGITVDPTATVYVADTNNHTIRRITPGAVVTTLAGLAPAFGNADGTAGAARFYQPVGVAVDATGTVYVADSFNHTIRRITVGGAVTTFAGLPGAFGSADGTGSAARFWHPFSVAVDTAGALYVADSGNNAIRKVTPAGVVTTLAGLAGNAGNADGTGSGARFNSPGGVAVDAAGTVYVADTLNHTIRRVTAGGVVTTPAGLAGAFGGADGTGSAARFYFPRGVAVDAAGTVYVADQVNYTIRRITAGGVVTTLAGLARVPGSADGTGSAARFLNPTGLAVDGAGTVFVADSENQIIRRITTGGVVTTIGGLAGAIGSADGAASAARFFYPYGVAVDAAGSIYVADSRNNAIRKGVVTSPTLDTDSDGLPNEWETQFGLNPISSLGNDGASGDPDADGRTNAQELAAGTHPRGFHQRYLAEGASGPFFDARIALLNPGTTLTASVLLRFLKEDATTVIHPLSLSPGARGTVDPESLAGLEFTSFSTVVESDVMVVVDRTMTWGGGYGSHAETALVSPSTTWYLAEGATGIDFQLFYLLQNPNSTPVTATVRYLLPDGLAPILRPYSLPPNSRTTVHVNNEDPALAATDVSAEVIGTQPIIVERAMYLNKPGQPFAAGHGSAGVTAPALEWFLAEGATGPFFDLFVLIANPNPTPATVTVDYLLLGGGVRTKSHTIPANGRFTIYVDQEEIPVGSGQRPLVAESLSTIVRATNGVPVIVERAMWWPGPEVSANVWYEAHNSPGATTTGTKWALAEGEVGGAAGMQTFVLLANTSATAGSARVTLHFEDGTEAERTYTLPANSRTNVAVAGDFPEAVNRRFGAIIESLGATPAPIVVERAMYFGEGWTAGTNALATRLEP
jgi:hypothetical protein